MSLSLRIKYQKFGTTSETLKVIKFAPNQGIAEACRMCQEKIGEGGPDHGLFQPGNDGRRPPRWLRADRTLAFYDLQNNVPYFSILEIMFCRMN
jgi:hypothetical protein